MKTKTRKPKTEIRKNSEARKPKRQKQRQAREHGETAALPLMGQFHFGSLETHLL